MVYTDSFNKGRPPIESMFDTGKIPSHGKKRPLVKTATHPKNRQAIKKLLLPTMGDS